MFYGFMNMFPDTPAVNGGNSPVQLDRTFQKKDGDEQTANTKENKIKVSVFSNFEAAKSKDGHVKYDEANANSLFKRGDFQSDFAANVKQGELDEKVENAIIHKALSNFDINGKLNEILKTFDAKTGSKTLTFHSAKEMQEKQGDIDNTAKGFDKIASDAAIKASEAANTQVRAMYQEALNKAFDEYTQQESDEAKASWADENKLTDKQNDQLKGKNAETEFKGGHAQNYDVTTKTEVFATEDTSQDGKVEYGTEHIFKAVNFDTISATNLKQSDKDAVKAIHDYVDGQYNVNQAYQEAVKAAFDSKPGSVKLKTPDDAALEKATAELDKIVANDIKNAHETAFKAVKAEYTAKLDEAHLQYDLNNRTLPETPKEQPKSGSQTPTEGTPPKVGTFTQPDGGVVIVTKTDDDKFQQVTKKGDNKTVTTALLDSLGKTLSSSTTVTKRNADGSEEITTTDGQGQKTGFESHKTDQKTGKKTTVKQTFTPGEPKPTRSETTVQKKDGSSESTVVTTGEGGKKTTTQTIKQKDNNCINVIESFFDGDNTDRSKLRSKNSTVYWNNGQKYETKDKFDDKGNLKHSTFTVYDKNGTEMETTTTDIENGTKTITNYKVNADTSATKLANEISTGDYEITADKIYDQNKEVLDKAATSHIGKDGVKLKDSNKGEYIFKGTTLRFEIKKKTA